MINVDSEQLKSPSQAFETKEATAHPLLSLERTEVRCPVYR